MHSDSDLNSDLHVEQLSDALSGRALDVVVSGSIGAVESVRFIRALRRLGADVTPWLTAGGAQFITPLALAWAAGREARTTFAGDASHIALGDACLVTPASASLIAKIAHGITDSPASALVTSYLGLKRPVLLLPNMHESLAAAPAVQKNIETLKTFGVVVLDDRREEGKRKFPEPATLADHVAHVLNHVDHDAGVLVTMGTTRGYIDDVRYVSNYSTGGLGSRIVEELYRLGLDPHVVAGPSEVKPRVSTSFTAILTNDEMAAACERIMKNGACAAVLAASILDFTPTKKTSGKIASAEHERLTVELARTKKIIADIVPPSGVKVGFKLETGLTRQRATEIAHDYIGKYSLSLMVLNDLKDVDRTRHQAMVFEDATTPTDVESKDALARLIAAHVQRRLVKSGDARP